MKQPFDKLNIFVETNVQKQEHNVFLVSYV